MFPTTRWTMIRRAGESETEALERFAQVYRGPVLRFIRAKGFSRGDAEDLCQDVFVRLLRSGTLAKADARRGRFRSLLLTIASRLVLDRRRKHQAEPVEDLEFIEADPDFDREWTLELVERALEGLKEEESPYYEVLQAHLAGEPDSEASRNQLWIARRKLAARIRHEVAVTCSSPSQVEDELAHLAPYLDSSKKG